MIKLKYLVLQASYLCASILVTSVAWSQPRLEEVVVTAQKTSQMIQDVPISLTALSGDELGDAGIDNLQDLTAYVPNFKKVDTPNGALIKVRGISSGINPGFEQSVMLYMDDVSLGRAPLARTPFMDLERIEVLRGPQNVLLGKNSIAGALSLITAKPTYEPEGSVFVSLNPEYDENEVSGTFSGALSETLRGRIALRKAEYGGYYENTTFDQNEESRDEDAVRLSLSWDVTDNVEILFKVEHDEIKSEGSSREASYSYLDSETGLNYAESIAALSQLSGQNIGQTEITLDRKNDSSISEPLDLNVDLAQVTIDWDLDDITVTFITGYAAYDEKKICDCDYTAVNGFLSNYREEYEQFSQEIRIVQDTGETFNWILGAFYQSWDLEYRSFTSISDDPNIFTAIATDPTPPDPQYALLGVMSNLRTPRQFDSESESWSVFGQFTYHASDTLRVTLGGRYTQEDKSAFRRVDSINAASGQFELTQALFTEGVFGLDVQSLGETGRTNSATGLPYNTHTREGDRQESVFTPSIIIEWDYSDDAMLYFNASEGFKAGGYDGSANREKDFEFEDEGVLSFELGSKSIFWDGRAELNVAIFYTDYTDLQVSVFDGFTGFVVGNAGNAISQGVELDGRLLLAEGLTLSGNLGYIDFEYSDWQGASCSSIRAIQRTCDNNEDRTVDNTGKTAARTPQITANLGLDYIVPLTEGVDFRTALDLQFSDAYYTEESLDKNLSQDAYTLVNLRFALDSEDWTLALLGKNLTDEDVVIYSVDMALSGDLFNAPAFSSYMSAPRTVALQAEYRF